MVDWGGRRERGREGGGHPHTRACAGVAVDRASSPGRIGGQMRYADKAKTAPILSWTECGIGLLQQGRRDALSALSTTEVQESELTLRSPSSPAITGSSPRCSGGAMARSAGEVPAASDSVVKVRAGVMGQPKRQTSNRRSSGSIPSRRWPAVRGTEKEAPGCMRRRSARVERCLYSHGPRRGSACRARWVACVQPLRWHSECVAVESRQAPFRCQHPWVLQPPSRRSRQSTSLAVGLVHPC